MAWSFFKFWWAKWSQVNLFTKGYSECTACASRNWRNSVNPVELRRKCLCTSHWIWKSKSLVASSSDLSLESSTICRNPARFARRMITNLSICGSTWSPVWWVCQTIIGWLEIPTFQHEIRQNAFTNCRWAWLYWLPECFWFCWLVVLASIQTHKAIIGVDYMIRSNWQNMKHSTKNAFIFPNRRLNTKACAIKTRSRTVWCEVGLWQSGSH